MIIYKIENKINGKCYIGKTKHSLEHRIKRYLREKGCLAIHNALLKYGIENFDISVIAQAENDGDLNALEISFISTYKSLYPNGYNLTNGGDGGSGKKSEAFKRHMSKVMLGNTNGLGTKRTEQTKKNQSKARIKFLQLNKDKITKGESVGTSKLTCKEVRNIKIKLNEKVPMTELSREFNVSYSTIQSIKYGKYWTHITV